MSATQPSVSHVPQPTPQTVEQEVEEILANAKEWLDTPNDRFEGRPPRALINTGEEQRLRDLLDVIKHGMAS